MSESRPPRDSRMDHNPTFSKEEMRRESGRRGVGSRLTRTVPDIMKGSWGIVIIRERMVSRGSVERERLSTVIAPEELSRVRRRTQRREDLPLCVSISGKEEEEIEVRACLPVLLQMPIFSPCLMVKETSFNAGGLSLRFSQLTVK